MLVAKNHDERKALNLLGLDDACLGAFSPYCNTCLECSFGRECAKVQGFNIDHYRDLDDEAAQLLTRGS